MIDFFNSNSTNVQTKAAKHSYLTIVKCLDGAIKDSILAFRQFGL